MPGAGLLPQKVKRAGSSCPLHSYLQVERLILANGRCRGTTVSTVSGVYSLTGAFPSRRSTVGATRPAMRAALGLRIRGDACGFGFDSDCGRVSPRRTSLPPIALRVK